MPRVSRIIESFQWFTLILGFYLWTLWKQEYFVTKHGIRVTKSPYRLKKSQVERITEDVIDFWDNHATPGYRVSRKIAIPALTGVLVEHERARTIQMPWYGLVYNVYGYALGSYVKLALQSSNLRKSALAHELSHVILGAIGLTDGDSSHQTMKDAGFMEKFEK